MPFASPLPSSPRSPPWPWGISSICQSGTLCFCSYSRCDFSLSLMAGLGANPDLPCQLLCSQCSSTRCCSALSLFPLAHPWLQAQPLMGWVTPKVLLCSVENSFPKISERERHFGMLLCLCLAGIWDFFVELQWVGLVGMGRLNVLKFLPRKKRENPNPVKLGCSSLELLVV